ncbi:hypothetical protein GCM10027053_47500 [Intrasporangium mesophilum]
MTDTRTPPSRARGSVFVSASIPDPARWTGQFDPLAITDAVVSVARTVLASGRRLVTAAHPTIAPLLLYVAAEQPPSAEALVVVYQSEVFEAFWPRATHRFQEQGVGTVIRTPRVGNEPPDPRHAPMSLELMRQRLLTNEPLVAAVFIGGMGGIPDEHALFRETHPDAPTYALAQPGGAAATLVDASPRQLQDILATENIYPAVARAIVADIASRL